MTPVKFCSVATCRDYGSQAWELRCELSGRPIYARVPICQSHFDELMAEHRAGKNL